MRNQELKKLFMHLEIAALDCIIEGDAEVVLQ